MKTLTDETEIRNKLEKMGFTEGRKFYHPTTEYTITINPKCISLYVHEKNGVTAGIGCYIIWNERQGITGEFKD